VIDSSEAVPAPASAPAASATKIQKTSSLKKSDKTGSKTKLTKVETAKKEVANSKKGGSSVAVVAAMLALLVGVGYYVYQSLQDPPAEMVATKPTASPKARVPAQANPQGAPIESVAKQATLVLSHFDKQKMQAFIDGERVELNSLEFSSQFPLLKILL